MLHANVKPYSVIPAAVDTDLVCKILSVLLLNNFCCNALLQDLNLQCLDLNGLKGILFHRCLFMECPLQGQCKITSTEGI